MPRSLGISRTMYASAISAAQISALVGGGPGQVLNNWDSMAFPYLSSHDYGFWPFSVTAALITQANYNPAVGPPGIRYTTGTTNPSANGFYYNPSPGILPMNSLYRWRAAVDLVQLTNCRLWLGLAPLGKSTAAGWATDTLAYSFVGFRYSAGVDGKFQAVMNVSGTQSISTSQVAPVASAFTVFELSYDGASNWTYWINGSSVVTINNAGNNSALLGPCGMIDNKSSSTAVSFDVFWWKTMLQSGYR